MSIACVLPLALGALLAMSACSRPQDAASSSSSATSASSGGAVPEALDSLDASRAAHEQAATAAAPVESGLSIRRGIVTLAQDRAMFRACDERVELALVDQGETPLAQLLEVSGAPATFYVEAYGERAPATPVPGSAAGQAGVKQTDQASRASSGPDTFVLEQLLYAGVPGETRGCEGTPRDYVVAARGNEPFWAAEVGEASMTWRQPQAPQEIELGPAQAQNAEGTVRYDASAGGHELELLVTAQPCRDSMSGEFFAYAARAVLDGRTFNGCARVGR